MADKQNRSMQSCREIIQKYGGYVKTIVMNKLGRAASREDIEDCISDVFAELYNSPHNNTIEDDELKTLLGTIAKRRAIDYFRKLTRQEKVTADADDMTLSALPSGDDTESEIEERAVKKALWNAVFQLGEPDSSILVYQYFYRKKVHKIAKLLSMSTAAVHKRSKRARERVREILTKQGY